MLFKRAIKVDTLHKFSVVIRPLSQVDENNKIAFYTGSNIIDGYNLYYNNSNLDNMSLSLNIYGGESKGFWTIFTIFCEIFFTILIIYIEYLHKNKKSIKSNIFIQAGILGIISVIMMIPFMKTIPFVDENDYIIGGIYMHNGDVLYKDLINQHMPTLYYITAFFTIFKAASIAQFRVCLYILLSIIYMFWYIRYSKVFGKIKMFVLPIVLIAFQQYINYESMMVLADNLQTIFILTLFMEFLAYIRDEQIDWKRAIIVSICIFGCITSIFISIYQIFAVFLGVVIKEIAYWRKSDNKFSFKNFKKRYYKLFIACIIPFVIFIIYLLITNSLTQFWEQAFKFNTEVYSNYKVFNTYDNLGTDVIKPMIMGFKNFYTILFDFVKNICIKKDLMFTIFELLLIIIVLINYIILLINKKYIEVVTSLLLICFGLVRTNYGFHTLPAWSCVLFSGLVFIDLQLKWQNLVRYVIGGVFLFMLFIGYFINYKKYLNFKPYIVSYLERDFINETKEGDDVFVDFYSLHSPIYFVYKDRNIINKCWFVLPWYMDWYQDDTIEELEINKPETILYYEKIDDEIGVWGQYNFADKLQEYIHANYRQTGSEFIWKLTR